MDLKDGKIKKLSYIIQKQFNEIEYYKVYLLYNGGLEFNIIVDSLEYHKIREWYLKTDNEEYIINKKTECEEPVKMYNDDMVIIKRKNIVRFKAEPIKSSVSNSIYSRYILTSKSVFNGIYFTKFAVYGGLIIYLCIALTESIITNTYLNDMLPLYNKGISILSMCIIFGILIEMLFKALSVITKNRAEVIGLYYENKQIYKLRNEISSLAIVLLWYILL